MSEMNGTMLANKDYRRAESSDTPSAAQPSLRDSVVDANLARRDQQALQVRIRRYNLTRITQIIWLATGVLESLIAIRVLLKLMAANPSAGFAAFIYNMTAVFLAPFFGLTATPSANGSVLELSSLIAMLVYALLAWGIVRVLWIVFEKAVIQ